MPTKAEWAAARFKYETDPDCSQTSLGEELGCSQQAVAKRCKSESWIKADLPDEVESLDIVKPVSGSKLGIRSKETIAELVNVYAMTGNKASACRIVGIDEKTLHNWCKEDPKLSIVMSSYRDKFLLGQFQKIATARDWKAAKEILARAPETKDQWGHEQQEAPKIILNIHRDIV